MAEWGDANGDSVRITAARQLILIARDLRTAGDLNIVRITQEGVNETPITLAGELELIAMGLDYAGCMEAASIGPDDDPQGGCS